MSDDSVIRLFGYSVIRKSHSAFTIVELLMVIGVIGILMGIVTTAASESVKASRQRKADALCKLVEAGFANYYAQYDQWPGSIGSRIANGSIGTRSNDNGAGGQSDTEEYELTGPEVRDCIKAMVDETKKGNPVLDVSGLFVSRNDGEPDKSSCNCRAQNHQKYSAPRNAYGLDFMSAVRGTKRSKKKMKTAEMYFGYPHPDNGGFIRFRVIYSIPTDSFKVTKWHWPGSGT